LLCLGVHFNFPYRLRLIFQSALGEAGAPTAPLAKPMNTHAMHQPGSKSCEIQQASAKCKSNKSTAFPAAGLKLRNFVCGTVGDDSMFAIRCNRYYYNIEHLPGEVRIRTRPNARTQRS